MDDSLCPPVADRPAALYLPLEPLDVGPGEDLLRHGGVEVLHLTDRPSPKQLGRVVAVLAGYSAVDAELLDRLPAVRMVVTHSAGVDMVDLDEVRARGLWLANLPDGATEEVAVHALAMALAVVRRLPHFDEDVREGRWDTDTSVLPQVPRELTCGVVGLGRIGCAFARLAGGVFGRVVAFDPALPSDAWPAGVEPYPDLDAMLAASDCVSLHVPLADGTRHLLDGRRLALLPQGAVVVNVSRGGLIDTSALLQSLDEGHLSGAACDVLEIEPPDPEDPVLTRRDVLLSPHVGYLSAAALRRYAETPARNVLALLSEGRPLNPVLSPADGSPARTSP